MKLLCSLDYRTVWGEDMRVEVTLHGQNGKSVTHLFPLETKDGYTWRGEILVMEKTALSWEYRYCVCSGDRVVRREWNGEVRSFPFDARKTFVLNDYWKDLPILNHLYSSAYTCSMRHSVSKTCDIMYFDQTLLLRVQAPQLERGECLGLVGSMPQLGEWMPERALPMSRGGIHEWCLTLSATGLQFPFEYKYVVMDEKTGEVLRWEEGDNRRSPVRPVASQQVEVIWNQRLRIKENHWKAAGVVLPIFSMRSASSQGIGDFGDLRKMVDWASRTGMKVIQILPINDTTQCHDWRDSYPYNSISIYALNPVYIDLRQLPEIHDEEFMSRHLEQRLELNALPAVDWTGVSRLKWDYLRRLYMQDGAGICAGGTFQRFVSDNPWTLAYSVYCYMRDTEGTSDFRQWSSLSQYDEKEVRRMAAEHEEEVNFYVYVQFLLATQLSSTTRYARSQGVVLKGDIPIGIARTSVEAWAEPEYFNMEGSAGAPPDAFSRNGQNWGFPTYNWDVMAKDGYAWWINRFRNMNKYFDAYRIDHVLGFFRIWEIPMHSIHGLLGRFRPSLPMSIEEIQSYDLSWREIFYTNPYITDRVIRTLLSSEQDIETLRTTYLEAMGPDWYRLREEVSTQRKVHDLFQGKDDESSVAIREALYTLISNVLFIEDEEMPEHFHPRIGVQDTTIYAALSAKEKEAFDRIYEHYYYHRHNDFWGEMAMRKLPTLVESTKMLVCAEDLGMVPACVGPVMDNLKILSLEIQTMPKAMGVQFARLEENPYRSVATIFTHDMETLRLWWHDDADRRQSFWHDSLQKDGKAPEVMPAWLCEEVIARHIYCPSMLCLISLQDWMSMDDKVRLGGENATLEQLQSERINVPADANNYWRYRMHINIEDLLKEEAFNDKIKVMIERGGR